MGVGLGFLVADLGEASVVEVLLGAGAVVNGRDVADLVLCGGMTRRLSEMFSHQYIPNKSA